MVLLYLTSTILLGGCAYIGLDLIAPRWLAALGAFWAAGGVSMLGLVRHSVLYSDENEGGEAEVVELFPGSGKAGERGGGKAGEQAERPAHLRLRIVARTSGRHDAQAEEESKSLHNRY
jgi:hypothetical protein